MSRRSQYRTLSLHPDGSIRDAAARQRLWWLIMGLAILSLFLLSAGLSGGAQIG